MPKGPPWSEAETAELIRLHSLMFSAREIAALLQRPSRNAVLGKLNRLGLCTPWHPDMSARRTAWTKERVAELRRHRRAGKTVAEIAAVLGTTEKAVQSKARALFEPSTVVPLRAPGGAYRRAEPPPASRQPPPPRGVPVPFLEAGRGACRYPLWNGRPPLAERLVCGADTEPGWSYCRRHHAECINPRRPGL